MDKSLKSINKRTIIKKIINGIKKFVLSYILLLKKPKLLFFTFLYTFFYLINSNKDISNFLIDPILKASIWKAFGFKFNAEQAGLQILFLLSLFFNFIFSWINIIINTAMSSYFLKNLKNQKTNILTSLKEAIKISLNYLNWIFIFTIIDLALRKFLAKYSLASIIFLVYLISYVIFILISTWVNLNLSINKKDLMTSIKDALNKFVKYKFEILGIFLLFLTLLPLSFLARLLNLVTINYSYLGILSSALDLPLIIIVFLVFFIIALSFCASTVLAVLLISPDFKE